MFCHKSIFKGFVKYGIRHIRQVDDLVQVHPLLRLINKVCITQSSLGFYSQALDQIRSFGKDFFRDPIGDQESMCSQTLNERQEFNVFERTVGDDPKQVSLVDDFKLRISSFGA